VALLSGQAGKPSVISPAGEDVGRVAAIPTAGPKKWFAGGEKTVDKAPLLERVRARGIGVRPSDRLLAAGAAALAVGTLPLRRWLLEREASR